MNLLKEHLFGESSEIKSLDEEERSPASVPSGDGAGQKGKINDQLYEQIKKRNSKEGKRLIDEISRLPVDE